MENMSSRKRERNERKNNISYYENRKQPKNEETNNCMKEGIDRVTKLIENWTEESSVTGVLDTIRNIRRECYEDIKEWMHYPRAIGKHTKITHFLQCKRQ